MKTTIVHLIERYLLALAKSLLSRAKPYIIGVTGSVGKTTTRYGIYQVLKGCGLSVKQTEGNLNSDLGIAISVLGYDHSPAIWEWPFALIAMSVNWISSITGLKKFEDYYVVEMGIDRLGDMKRLLRTIRPTIGIVTWIGEGHHLEFLKDPATIADEKGLILTVLPHDGLAIVPAHDDQTNKLEKMATAPVVKIKATGLDALPETIMAVTNHLGLDKEKVNDQLARIKQPKGRLQWLAGINNSTVLDDSYNASYPAVKLALEILAKSEGERKIAVLGDILEQGEKEAEVHTSLAKLARKQADIFVGVGKRFKETEYDQWFASPTAAAESLRESIKSGDVILVKGSQGMRMEKVSLALAADQKEAQEILPRQTKRWQQLPFRNP